jgi:hypothetical protein
MKYIFLIILVFLIIVSLTLAYRNVGNPKIVTFWNLIKWEAPSYKNEGRGFFNFLFSNDLEGSENKQQGSKKAYIQSSPPKSSYTSGETKSNYSTSSKNTSDSKKFSENQIKPPAGFSLKDLSPYYGLIKISYINPGYYSMGQISIYADYKVDKPINITGWKIKSNKGETIIPQAVSDYLPQGGGENGDIYLEKGGRLDIYNWVSANGKNFRLNKCIGYLNNDYNFKPQLPCSYVKMYERDEIATFTGKCQNYILSLSSCKIPKPQELNQFTNEPNCRFFLDRFSYTGCYNLHKNSSGFFQNKWMAWIPGFWNFDKDHDRVLLLDKNNLLVDIYTY